MDFNDSPQEADFRGACRSFLEANAKRNEGAPGVWRWQGKMSLADAVARAREWQGKKADAGFACIQWPKEHGGAGLSLMHAIIYDQEESEFEVPRGHRRARLEHLRAADDGVRDRPAEETLPT